jgi:hypothetical protein
MAQTQVYDFSTATDYTYNSSQVEVSGGRGQLLAQGSVTPYTEDFADALGLTFNTSLIEVTGGVARLRNLETPSTYTEDFSDSGTLTYNSSEVQVTAGSGSLALQNNSGQLFNEDFANDAGFTYNASNTEFSGGQVQQIQKTYKPNYYLGTFFASYDSSIDGDYGGGDVTGTPTGGASITGNRLDLAQSDVRYVTYEDSGLVDFGQVGTIRFKYTPNYTNSPVADRSLFFIQEDSGSNFNQISLTHRSSGQILIYTRNNVGGGEINTNWHFWQPTTGTTYEIEMNFDFTTGASRLFIDGTQQGITLPNSYTRSATSELLRVGFDRLANTTDGYFEDFIVFDTVQHTSNYVPAPYGLDDPKQPTFYAGYDEDVNGDWGDGTLTSTPVGGANVAGGALDLKYSDVRYVDYATASNVDGMVDQGCIRFRVTPNYSGTPGSDQIFVNIGVAANSNNKITIYHNSGTGFLEATMRDSTSGNIIGTGAFALWNPTASTEYEIEFNFDAVAGVNRIFVNGNQLGATDTNTGTRSGVMDQFRVGSGRTGVESSNFEINDILVFNNPQHTTNYTPDWSDVLPYEYYGDVITLPEMVDTYPGTLVSFDAFSTTEVNSPRYTLQIGRSGNYLWWDGGSWSTSNNTYTQANDWATFNANCSSLPINGEIYGQFRVYTQNNIGLQQSVDELTASLTAQIYSTSNPTLDLDTLVTATATGQAVTALNSFTETVTEIGSDEIRYVLSNDNGITWQWWNGGSWAVSSGYSESNTGADINTNIGSLTPTTTGTKIRVYLHSNNGLTSPSIDNLIVGYDDHIYSTANPTVDLDNGITPIITGGTVTGWTSFSEVTSVTGVDFVRYSLSDDGGSTYRYWNGSTWAVSTGYAMSNTGAEINTNIASFPRTTSGMKVRVYLHSNSGNARPSIDTLSILYTDAAYLTTNPTIETATGINLDGITSIAISDGASGSDAVRYTVVTNGTERYYSGGSWQVSDGTYSQTNTKNEMIAWLPSFDATLGYTTKIKAYLHSDTGVTTPYVDTITLVYSFYGGDPTEPNRCIAYSNMRDIDGTAPEDVTVKIQPANNCKYGDEIIVTTTPMTITPNANGYFELDIIPSNLLTPNTDYKVTFKGTKFRRSDTVTIPNQTNVNYATLVSS